MVIHIWPDGFWCEHEDLELALTWHSDDFFTVDVGDMDLYLIDEHVAELIK